MFYNPRADKFHRLDCACYSYNKLVNIRGYDAKSQIIKGALPKVEMPIILDEIK